MRYFEQSDGEYILAYGIAAHGGTEIAKKRYDAILAAVDAYPGDTETTSYRLKADLTWEPIAVEPVDTEISEAEAYNIIFGGAE